MKSALLLATLLCAACARAPVNPDDTGPKLADNPYCLHETGTGLRVPPGQCAGIGRAYSREQIEQAGGPTLGDTLSRLLPY